MSRLLDMLSPTTTTSSSTTSLLSDPPTPPTVQLQLNATVANDRHASEPNSEVQSHLSPPRTSLITQERLQPLSLGPSQSTPSDHRLDAPHHFPALSSRFDPPNCGIRLGEQHPEQPCATKSRRVEAATHASTPHRQLFLNEPLIPMRKHLNIYPGKHGDDCCQLDGAACTAPFREDKVIEAPYICVYCAFRFSNSEERRLHINQTHKPKRQLDKSVIKVENSFTCTRKSEPTLHSHLQGSPLPFRCEICNARFHQRNHLVRHSRAVHNNTDFAKDGCSTETFWIGQHVRCQKRSREKQKPLFCAFCDMRYCQKRWLRRHLGDFHGISSSLVTVLIDDQSRGKPPC